MIDPVFVGRLAKYAEDYGIIIYMTGKGGKRTIKDQQSLQSGNLHSKKIL